MRFLGVLRIELTQQRLEFTGPMGPTDRIRSRTWRLISLAPELLC
jgi:hypothetical protein